MFIIFYFVLLVKFFFIGKVLDFYEYLLNIFKYIEKFYVIV